MPAARNSVVRGALGLTSWAAFQNAGNHTMVMGDMVVLESQVNPVMSAALDNGLEVTALHNHFFGDNPKVMFMHIGGAGSQEKLAVAVGKVFAKIREPGPVPARRLRRSIPRRRRFAVLESELPPVLKTLRGANINVVATHQRMTNEQPRMMFLHYWGIGSAADLTKGVRAALDQTRH